MRNFIAAAIKESRKFIKKRRELNEKEKIIVYNVITFKTITDPREAFVEVFGKKQ